MNAEMKELDCVVVETVNGRETAVCLQWSQGPGRPSRLTWIVGGVVPYSGYITRIASLPYRSVGGDLWTMQAGDTVAILSDGTAVTMKENNSGVWNFLAAGRTYGCISDAAIAITPAR